MYYCFYVSKTDRLFQKGPLFLSSHLLHLGWGGTDSLKVANMCRPTAPPFTSDVEMTALSTGKFELTAPCFYSDRALKS